MPFCENCGKPVYALDKTCSNCGTPVPQATQAAPPLPPTAQAVDAEPAANSPYAVLGSWGFVGSILLLGLPIAGFILAIVWASGGTYNLNRRNLARAYLILLGLAIALYLVILIGIIVLGGTIGSLTNWNA